jgi:hypothetical protein
MSSSSLSTSKSSVVQTLEVPQLGVNCFLHSILRFVSPHPYTFASAPAAQIERRQVVKHPWPYTRDPAALLKTTDPRYSVFSHSSALNDLDSDWIEQREKNLSSTDEFEWKRSHRDSANKVFQGATPF